VQRRLSSEDGLALINIDAEGHEFAVLKGGEDLLSCHRPVLLIELEYRHGTPVAAIFDWLKARSYLPNAFIEGRHVPIDPVTLANLQSQDRLSRRLAGNRHSGYINNVFFVPEG
jgi:hypothetical protein